MGVSYISGLTVGSEGNRYSGNTSNTADARESPLFEVCAVFPYQRYSLVNVCAQIKSMGLCAFRLYARIVVAHLLLRGRLICTSSLVSFSILDCCGRLFPSRTGL